MNKNKLSRLIKIANKHDLSGNYKAADMIDAIMQKIANEEDFSLGLKIGDLVFDCTCDLEKNEIGCFDPSEDTIEAAHKFDSIEELKENIGEDIFNMITDHCNYSFLKSEKSYEETIQFDGEVSEESDFEQSGRFRIELLGLNALLDQGIFKLIKDEAYCNLIMEDQTEEYDSEYFVRE